MSQAVEEIRKRAYEVLDQKKYEEFSLNYFNVKNILLEKLDGREWNLADITEYSEVFGYTCKQATGFVCNTLTELTKEVVGKADMEIRCAACVGGSVFCERVRKNQEDFHYNTTQIWYRSHTIIQQNNITEEDREFINMCVEKAKANTSQLDDLLDVARRWSNGL